MDFKDYKKLIKTLLNMDVKKIKKTAERYREVYDELSGNKKTADGLKAQITEFARNNPKLFVGKVMQLTAGVRVESRVSVKAEFDESEAATVDWIDKAVDLGFGDAITINIDPKAMPEKLNRHQKAHLKLIKYGTTERETYAVCVDTTQKP